VKCRIGVDDQDPEEALDTLTRVVVAAGVDTLIVHARKAWLAGLSPKENREIPPLDYARVFRLKRAHPQLPIVLNGGIGDLRRGFELLDHVDGLMLGRAAYHEPWRLLAVDPLFYGTSAPATSAKGAAQTLIPYIERELAQGTRLYAILRHVLGLFAGVPGARAYRRMLATEAVKQGAGADVFVSALDLLPDEEAARDVAA
jgi:tRNA-dihydrouridine synthase A